MAERVGDLLVPGEREELLPAAEATARALLLRAHLLAEAGYWYDAIDQLSGWISADPGSGVLRRHRAALLEQVGLSALASGEPDV